MEQYIRLNSDFFDFSSFNSYDPLIQNYYDNVDSDNEVLLCDICANVILQKYRDNCFVARFL